jgi:hypothetical protein
VPGGGGSSTSTSSSSTSAGGGTTTTTTPTTTSTTSSVGTTTSSAPGAQQTLYGQCGGVGWTGPTSCASGTCKVSNTYYSEFDFCFLFFLRFRLERWGFCRKRKRDVRKGYMDLRDVCGV